MTIFRSSGLLLVLLVGACGSSGFKPRNDLEALLQGNVNDVIASLEAYIGKYEGKRPELEAKLLEAGFREGEFRAETSDFDVKRINCQFYNYRRKTAPGFGASAVVYLCDEGSGANFGYIAP